MSETLGVYQDITQPRNAIVTIRGTNPADSADWGADYLIASGDLPDANRFKRDYDTLKGFEDSAGPGAYIYYGLGHSLGGSILDELIKAGLIQSGLSFNSAVQTKDYSVTQNRRVYAYDDPLYHLLGQYAPGSERMPDVEHTWWSKAIDFAGWLGGPISLVRQAKGLADYLWYHKLARFVPGESQDKSPTDLVQTGGSREPAERLTEYLERILEHNNIPEARESEYLHDHIDRIMPMLKAHWKKKGWSEDDLIHEMIQFGNYGSSLFEPYVRNISPPAGGAKAVKIPKGEFIKEHTNLLGILKNPTPQKLQKEYRSQKKELMNIAMPDWVRDHMPKGRKMRGGANTQTLEAHKQDAIRTLEGLQSFADSNGQGADNRAAIEKIKSVNASEACEPGNIQKIKDGQAQVDSTLAKNKLGLSFYPSKKKDLQHVKDVLGQMLAECQKSGAGRRGGFAPYNRTTPATNCKTSEWNCVKTSGRQYGSDFGGVACYDTDPKYCQDSRRFPDGPPYEQYA